MSDVGDAGGTDRIGRDRVHAAKTAMPTTAVAVVANSHGLAPCATGVWPGQAVPSFKAASTIKPMAQAKPPIQTRLRINAIEAR